MNSFPYYTNRGGDQFSFLRWKIHLQIFQNEITHHGRYQGFQKDILLLCLEVYLYHFWISLSTYVFLIFQIGGHFGCFILYFLHWKACICFLCYSYQYTIIYTPECIWRLLQSVLLQLLAIEVETSVKHSQLSLVPRKYPLYQG